MIKRLTSLLALSAFALNATAEPVAVSLPAFQCLGSKEGVRLPSKLSQLRKLGKLNEEQTINVEQWDGYKAIEKQLRFNGLTVLVITFTNEPERYMLSAVNIETPGWSVSPIRIGSPVQELLARVGVVGSQANASWRFAGESDSLYVEARNGSVVRVAYECYTG